MLRAVLSRTIVRDTGGVLAAWLTCASLENVVVAIRRAGSSYALRDFVHAELVVVPLALVYALPLALLAVGIARLIARGHSAFVAGAAALASTWLAVELTAGRQLAGSPARVPLVATASLLAFACVWALGRGARRAPPRVIAAFGAMIGVAAWMSDAYAVQARYPAFHAALFAVALAGTAAIHVGLRSSRVGTYASAGALGMIALGLVVMPLTQRRLREDEHLRRTMIAHAPALGRAVVASATLAPARAADDEHTAVSFLARTPVARTLDWSGCDIVVVTVDALRADHLGAYGYARPTSPNLDALARRGTRFDHAYAAVPNTSYALSSLMTGRYMRPLLQTGTGEGILTLPQRLERAGYVTAGFFPPAVFYVDEHRFGKLRHPPFGFMNVTENFATPQEREQQVAQWLARVPSDKPVFVWVHVFEPHEPYVMHPEHPFEGGTPMDAYDSEIAAADALIGRVVALVEARRRPTAIIVTADHGEAFGEHGVNYHGSNLYEEQVRVPLVVAGPGVAPSVAQQPVQVVDVLPTVVSALGLPFPMRTSGHDLGPLLAGTRTAFEDQGFAFADTPDQTLVAVGTERLLCERATKSCALYDLSVDPAQKAAIRERPTRVQFLRSVTAAVEGGMRAPSDSAASSARAALEAELERLDDDGVRMRLEHAALDSRLAAALVLARRGLADGERVLLDRWESAFGPDTAESGDVEEATELLAALEKTHGERAVPVLLRSLDDVRLRGPVVEALGKFGDPRAKEPVFALLAGERFFDLRQKEVRALVNLGLGEELRAPLARFAIAAEPMPDAIQFAALAGLLRNDSGGATYDPPTRPTEAKVHVPGGGPARLLVMSGGPEEGLVARVDGVTVTMEPTFANLWTANLEDIDNDGVVSLDLAHPSGVRAIWIIRREAVERR